MLWRAWWCRRGGRFSTSPGNVRELRNTLERALFLTSGTLIDAEHIVLSESPGRAAPIRSTDTIRLGDLERQYILEVLATVGGNKSISRRSWS